MDKNTISKEKVGTFGLLNLLEENNNQTIVNQDINGDYHFNGNFNNARDLKNALEVLTGNPDYKKLVDKEERIEPTTSSGTDADRFRLKKSLKMRFKNILNSCF